MPCPLCESKESTDFYSNERRDFVRCCNCKLVFVSPEYHLSYEDEKSRYDLHQNSPEDEGYKKFLSRLTIPLQKRLKAKSNGLDFGSGPGPTLSKMLEDKGYSVDIYDYFYATDKTVFDKQFDFITATEVFEHLRNPGQEIKMLWELLNPGGILGIMTKLLIDQQAFPKWHYIMDRTHICFFSEKTFMWLSNKLKARLEFIGSDVIMLTKC